MSTIAYCWYVHGGWKSPGELSKQEKAVSLKQVSKLRIIEIFATESRGFS